jgi:hypothetical protein
MLYIISFNGLTSNNLYVYDVWYILFVDYKNVTNDYNVINILNY